MKNNKNASEICVQCQACCKKIGVYSANPYTEENKEFYEARGAKVTKRIGNNIEYMFLDFPFPCPNLDPIKGCLIYNTRPKVCKEYPVDDSQLVEDCELHKQGFL